LTTATISYSYTIRLANYNGYEMLFKRIPPICCRSNSAERKSDKKMISMDVFLCVKNVDLCIAYWVSVLQHTHKTVARLYHGWGRKKSLHSTHTSVMQQLLHIADVAAAFFLFFSDIYCAAFCGVGAKTTIVYYRTEIHPHRCRSYDTRGQQLEVYSSRRRRSLYIKLFFLYICVGPQCVYAGRTCFWRICPQSGYI